MGFEKLSHVIEVEAAYTAKSSLAIHAGDSGLPQMVDNPIVHIGGQPAIPGSTLKGALRSAIEALLADAGKQVCVPYTAIPQTIRREGRADRYVGDLGRLQPCPADRPCPTCRLFGTAGGREGLAGIVMVMDARVVGSASVGERTHVAITRDTRSQSGGALVTQQVVDAGAEFVGTIRLINPEDWQVGAVLVGLDSVALLGIGAKKSAGYGEVDVQVRGITRKRRVAAGWEDELLAEDAYRKAFADFTTQSAGA